MSRYHRRPSSIQRSRRYAAPYTHTRPRPHSRFQGPGRSTHCGPSTSVVKKNPLLFPEVQIKLAQHLLDQGVGPDELSKLFGLESSLEGAKGKPCVNLHRLNAFLINKWVIDSGRPDANILADLFKNEALQSNIKTFCHAMIEREKVQFTPCSKGKRSFKLIKFLLTWKGKFIAVCSEHCTDHIGGTGSWCYSKDYSKDTVLTDAKKASVSEQIQGSTAATCSGQSSSLKTSSVQQFLKNNCQKMIDTLSVGPTDIADALFEAGLIPDETWEEVQELSTITKRQKARRLYQGICSTTNTLEKCNDLVSVLGNYKFCSDIIKEMLS